MKCQICKLREGRHTYNHHGNPVKICTRCRRSTFPTDTERKADDLNAERQGEYT